MCAINFCQIDVCYDVGIDDHERLIIPEVGYVFDRPAGTQYFRLMTGENFEPVFLLRQKIFDLPMQMVGVDDNGLPVGVLFPAANDPQNPRDMHKAFGELTWGCQRNSKACQRERS